MNEQKLQCLRIDQGQKSRPKQTFWVILFVVLAITGLAAFFALRNPDGGRRLIAKEKSGDATAASAKSDAPPVKSAAPAASNNASPTPAKTAPASAGSTLLTVSGYIIARERIELSPRFMGMVKWIGVKKGDTVTNGQVVVRLDDAEFQARLQEADGRLGSVKVNVERTALDLKRSKAPVATGAETQKAEDDARLAHEAALASVKELEGSVNLIKTYIDWTIIRSPINGVVLEKLVDPNELVTPQSFGGTRGPSTALIALADPNDLQVEIDLNESDVAKISLNQKCKVSPEAYLDRSYDGYVAEIAPEASRQKGTLQIKVQIKNPDKFLTPELSAKVDFLAVTQ